MNRKNRQGGATLIEILIGLALSLIVTSSMVALMGNSMGTSTRIIQMTQLSDELRNAMSMMTRDVRRANYSAHAIYCYANEDCDETIVSDVEIDGSAADLEGSCVTFNVDRDQNNFNNLTAREPGGFRLADDNGIGFLEMWVGDGSVDCTSDSGEDDDDWFALTDPDFVDITTFVVRRTPVEDSIEENSVTTLTLRTNRLDIELEGELRLDANISRRIVDRIRVRNDVITRS